MQKRPVPKSIAPEYLRTPDPHSHIPRAPPPPIPAQTRARAETHREITHVVGGEWPVATSPSPTAVKRMPPPRPKSLPLSGIREPATPRADIAKSIGGALIGIAYEVGGSGKTYSKPERR